MRLDTKGVRVRRVVVTGAAAVAVIGVIAWTELTNRTAGWVVSEVRSDERTLVLGWTSHFGVCDHRPSVVVGETAREVRVRATYRTELGLRCGLKRELTFSPAVVRLARPLAGRRIIGDGQASVPVPPSYDTVGIMPSVVGMNIDSARLALSRAGYREDDLPLGNSSGAVGRQSPRAGSTLRFRLGGGSPDSGGRYVSGPLPRLGFGR